MKRVLIVAVLALCCSLAGADDSFRVFTDDTGRAISARILKYDARKRTILVQLDNGRQGNIPVPKLSEEDQKYVFAWAQLQDFMDERRFKISAKREKHDNDADSHKGNVQSRDVENMGYEIELENRSDITFLNVKLEYCIFYEQEINTRGGEDAKQGVYCDSVTVSRMLPKDKKTLQTGNVKIYKEELSSEYHWVDGTDNVQRGEVHGLWLRASIEMDGGEKVIRDFCLPDSIPNSHRWTTHSVNVGMN